MSCFSRFNLSGSLGTAGLRRTRVTGLLAALLSLGPMAPAADPKVATNATPSTSGGQATNALSASMEFVRRGNQAFRDGNRPEALALFSQAIDANPTNLMALYNRGRINDTEGNYTNALADYNHLLELNPKNLGATQLRGALHLRLGQFPEAIADYDRYIEALPKTAQRHWQRGIACYLSGRYEAAGRQFAQCHTTDTNDVEHVVWHFLSMAKTNSIEKARSNMLPAGRDRRPVMNEIYDIYAGKLRPDDLLKKMETPVEGQPQAQDDRFRAHYYMGQYFDVIGDPKRSLELLNKASQMKSMDSLMQDLARLQANLSQAKVKEKPSGR